MESDVKVSNSKYPGYQEYVDGAAFSLEQPSSGYLRLTGPDRIDFLQRQTTNDVRTLAENQSVVTVLTSPTARILDVFTLLAESEAIGLIPLPGRGQAAAEYLRNRIFFMDDVTLEDASSAVFQVVLGGTTVADLLGTMGMALSSDVSAGTVKLDDQVIRWIAERALFGTCYRLLVSPEARGILLRMLERAGITNLPAETYQVARVEAGLPSVSHELTEDYTPFEIGLDWAVSTTKGCYTGQEVLARQITYDKVARQLVGLRLDRPAEVGAAIRTEDSRAGEVTSVADSPRFGPIALAVIRRGFAEIGTELTVFTADTEVKAQVATLPFSKVNGE